MKRFLTHLLLWLIVALILSFGVDTIITCGLRKTDIRKYVVWNDIYKGKINADVLVIGSSRAWCGYNTYILDSLLNCNSYNLGLDGHPLDFQLLRYETYRRFNSKPSLILLNTDFLSTLDNSANLQYEREQFFPYINDFELINTVSDPKHITWLERHLPLVRYFGYREDIDNGLASFFGKKHFFDGGLYKGYRGNDWGWNPASLNKDTIFNVRINWNIVEALDGFMENSETDGIHVIFVKSPVYQPLYNHFSGIQLTDSIFASIAEKYKVPILDYYYSPIGLDSTYFYNPSHLNTKGAEVFSKQLCEDIDSLLRVIAPQENNANYITR